MAVDLPVDWLWWQWKQRHKRKQSDDNVDPWPCVCGGPYTLDPDRPNIRLCSCGAVYELPDSDEQDGAGQ